MFARAAQFQGLDDRIEMVPLGAQRHGDSGGVVEGHAADRVLLPQEQVGQADGDGAGVLVLVHRPAAVAHAVRHVAQQRAAEVGVFLELFDVVAVLLRPDFPIDVAQVVAEGVLAMLAKLDRLAEVRTAMHAGEESLDDVPCAEIEPGDPLDRLRKQKSLGIVHRGSVRLRGWG